MTAAALTQRHSTLLPLALLLGAGTLLGLTSNLAKLGGEWGVAPLALLAWSITGATAILLAVAAWRSEWPPPTRRAVE